MPSTILIPREVQSAPYDWQCNATYGAQPARRPAGTLAPAGGRRWGTNCDDKGSDSGSIQWSGKIDSCAIIIKEREWHLFYNPPSSHIHNQYLGLKYVATICMMIDVVIALVMPAGISVH